MTMSMSMGVSRNTSMNKLMPGSRPISRSGSVQGRVDQCLGRVGYGMVLRNMDLNNTVDLPLTKNAILDHTYQQALSHTIHTHKSNFQQTQQTLQKTQTKVLNLLQSQSHQQSNTDTLIHNLKQQLQQNMLTIHELNVRLNQSQRLRRKCLEDMGVEVEEGRRRLDGCQREIGRLGDLGRIWQVQEGRLRGLIDKNRRGKQNQKDKEEHEQNRNKLQMLRQEISTLQQQNKQLQQQLLQSQTTIQQQEHQLSQCQNQIKQLRRILSQPHITTHKQPHQQQPHQQQPPTITVQKEIKDVGDGDVDVDVDVVQLKRREDVRVFQAANGEGIISAVVGIRNGINQEMVDLFVCCVKEAQNKKANTLSVFISKWRQLQISRIKPYLEAYFEASQQMQQFLQTHKQNPAHSNLITKITHTLPLQLHISQPTKLPSQLQSKQYFVYKTHSNHAQSKQKLTRSQINLWVLSSIQFTNNQYAMSSQPDLKKSVLYLFRLLSVEYRVMYPPKGKDGEYTLDTDVRNCLLHFIVEAVSRVIRSH